MDTERDRARMFFKYQSTFKRIPSVLIRQILDSFGYETDGTWRALRSAERHYANLERRPRAPLDTLEVIPDALSGVAGGYERDTAALLATFIEPTGKMRTHGNSNLIPESILFRNMLKLLGSNFRVAAAKEVLYILVSHGVVIYRENRTKGGSGYRLNFNSHNRPAVKVSLVGSRTIEQLQRYMHQKRTGFRP